MVVESDFFRYLPVNQRATQWGVYVTGTGCSGVTPGSRFPRTGHPPLYQFTWDKGRVLPEFQFIYLTRGSGVFESGPTGRIDVGAGDVVLLFPGVWHRYRPNPRTGWDSYWVGANGNYLHSLLEQGFFSPRTPILRIGLTPEVIHAYQTMLEQVRLESRVNPLLLGARTMEILAQIVAPPQPAESLADDSPIVEDRMVAKAIHFIWNQSHRPMQVEDVVAQVPLTRRSLERRFRRVLGRTILDEIMRCRLERVKRMLEETEVPIKRIAAIAGFTSAEHLSKVFRRLEGVSAVAYRQEYRSNC
jgi:AraC-like DNA-binding protein